MFVLSLFVCVCQHNWLGGGMFVFVCLFVFVNTTGLVERCLCFSLFVCVCQHSWLGTEMFIFVCLFVCVCQHRWLGRELNVNPLLW